MLLRALRPMRSVRAILLMGAAWMSVLAMRPVGSAESGRELVTTSSVDRSIAAPIARLLVVNDHDANARASRVTPLALFLCAAALLLLTAQTVERVRSDSTEPARIVDPRVAPYDAMAPPVPRLSSPAHR